jgi:hypothetical protein
VAGSASGDSAPSSTGKTAEKTGNGSVWESNPLRALFKPSTGFEDQSTKSPTSYVDNTSGDADKDLAFCLALLGRKSPDLALVVERWESLPEAVRAGIAAMVKAT